jgi:UDP-3-O-[3-hydroxymyristoyl] glucosamine N-acyltransferase
MNVKTEQTWTTRTLAEELGRTWQGPETEIIGCNTLERAGPREISFLANPKYASLLPQTSAGAVILSSEHAAQAERAIISPTPYLDFARVVRIFAKPQGELTGWHDMSFVHPEAVVDDSVTIYPHVTVCPRARIDDSCTLFSGVYVGEDCEIGSGCVLYPNVVLMAGTKLGRNVIVHAGVVIGSDGFGFAQAQSEHEKIPQIGRVVIEDEVEIGAGTTIDRAALGETRIGRGTKIDNLVQVGHNVQVGENSILVAQVGIAGSTRLGKNVILAGQVGVSGHLEIGDNCRVGAKSGVGKSLKPGTDWSGIPAVEHSKFLRMAATLPKTPDMHKKLKQLESEIQTLRGLIGPGDPDSD